MRMENIKWYIIGVLFCSWTIRSGIQGVRNRKRNNLTYFILSIGLIVAGVEGLVAILFIFLARELGVDLLGLVPK